MSAVYVDVGRLRGQDAATGFIRSVADAVGVAVPDDAVAPIENVASAMVESGRRLCLLVDESSCWHEATPEPHFLRTCGHLYQIRQLPAT